MCFLVICWIVIVREGVMVGSKFFGINVMIIFKVKINDFDIGFLIKKVVVKKKIIFIVIEMIEICLVN